MTSVVFLETASLGYGGGVGGGGEGVGSLV